MTIFFLFFILSFLSYQAKTSDFLLENIKEFLTDTKNIKTTLKKHPILCEKQDPEVCRLILQALFLEKKPLSKYREIKISSSQKKREFFDRLTSEAILKLTQTWVQRKYRELDLNAIFEKNSTMIWELLKNIHSIDQAYMELEAPSAVQTAYKYLKDKPFETLEVLFFVQSPPRNESAKWKQELEQCKMFLLPSSQAPHLLPMRHSLTTRCLKTLPSHPNQQELSKQIEAFFENLERLLQNLAQTSFAEREMSLRIFLRELEQLVQHIKFSQIHRNPSEKDLSLMKAILLALLTPSEKEPLSKWSTIAFTELRYYDEEEILLGYIDLIFQEMLASGKNTCDFNILNFFREAMRTSDNPHVILDKLTGTVIEHFNRDRE